MTDAQLREIGVHYDYETETLYWQTAEGRLFQLGSAGSFIWCCMTCGEEHFRNGISVREDQPENCFTCHTPMELLTDENITKAEEVWKRNGDHITTIEERRERRLAREADGHIRYRALPPRKGAKP